MKAIARLKKMFISLLMASLLLGVASSAFSQKLISGNNSFIVAITELYSSNLMTVNDIGYENLYLITCDKPIRTDSVMFELSKKNYHQMFDILDTLNHCFKVYSIVRDRKVSDSNADAINKHLMDCNNYRTAYLFSLNDTIKRYGPVAGYVVQRYSGDLAIEYSILNNKCDGLPGECTAVIKKLK